MHILQVLQFVGAAAALYVPCNDADGLDSGGVSKIPLSQGCSNASIVDGDWLTVQCDVGAKLGTFGIHLNDCLGPGGGAMGSCDSDQCTVIVKKGDSATMECHADNCEGTVDLDKVITYSGTWLETFGKLGSHGTVNSKRDDEDTKEKYSKFCDSANFNKDQWDEADLGTELVAHNYKNFMDALRDRVEGFKGYEGCNADDGCDDVEPDDEVCHMADLNPMWLMFMRSLKHYSAWIMAVQDGLLQGGDYARDNATNVIHQFSSHVDESSNEVGNILVMAAGLLGAFGAVIPGGSAIAGVGSGMSTIGVGLANIASTDDNAKRVQNMILRGDAMTQRIDDITTTMREYVNTWGIDLYAKPVWHDNDAYNADWYSDQDRSLPSLLKDGAFVEGHTNDVAAEIASAYGTKVNVGALAYAWYQENVFIIKLSDSVQGTKPCDIDWESTFETTYTCIDDVAYVFHKAKTSNNNGITTSPIDKPPNIDNLDDFDLPNQETLINAAINSQDLGGYLKDWTAVDMLEDWPEVDTTKIFNLPICELKVGSTIKGQKTTNVDWLVFNAIGDCTDQKDKFGTEFPYSFISGYYDF
ncbi:hypothetical protein N7481_013336 [Penicillium waksmanii]|uniref:uncharacterized protein n=1 Tax=Penicillium waksmanii TaxID=69791 RepID=UPI002546D7D8|nr:uncharacterized protein N7481_013336 [Penicillium waksmanii]KAJ5966622.1 hypothetical protein N7481_013336 [Penicillium waksmanii]